MTPAARFTAPEPDAHSATSAGRIRATGARATPARIRVLQLLASAPAALTHHDIDLALGATPKATTPDRVTLYRVLDWLVDSGLAHKSTDARGIFRFSLAATGEHTAHAHFNCETCGRVFCLDAAPPAPPNLPDGFQLSRMEIDLRGRCAACCEAHP